MSDIQPGSPLEYKVGDQPVPGYTLVRELGRGAMGVVWLARTDSGFEAAIKIIDLMKGGGKKEYRGLRTIKHRKIRHGNLLTLLDYWLKDREGNLIPDSDEIDATDSFFAPSKASGGPARPLAATMGHSAATQVGKAPAADLHRAGTLVARGTIEEAPGPTPAALTQGPGLGATVDFSGRPAGPMRRPVQLIVAMELGDSTLDIRQKQCQENKQPGVPVDELLQYMEHSARGLDHLHREGIVHRDVKPQNIMLVGDVAKVCDYGLIVTTDADLKATSNAFTPLYASPEAVADKPVTSQSDQYSLAVTYIELRTGHSPYSSETAASVYAAKETGKYDLSRVRESKVRSVLKRALAASPNDRYASCSQFVRELEKAEHAGSGVMRLVSIAAVVLLLGACAALAAPYLLNKEGGQIGKVADVDPNLGKVEQQPPPPPPPATIEEVRAARLAGHYDEALKRLAAAKDTTHWAFPIERLHIEMARSLAAQPAQEASQWEAWQQTADKLWAEKYGPGPELVQLSTLRIFTATRLDPAKLSFELPLADEFATIASGREHWKTVLSEDDRKNLEADYEILCQRFVELRQPLPPAWKARFSEVWPQPDGGLLLVERVRQSIHDGDEQGLNTAEADLTYVAREYNLEATPFRAELERVRPEIATAKQQLVAKWLTTRLEANEFLTDAASRKETIAELNRRAATGSSPLIQLARIEADMADKDAAGQRYPGRSLDELREIVKALSAAGASAKPEWLEQANFLLARVQLALRGDSYAATAANSPELQVLLNWPTADGAPWQNKRRTEQAADFLLSLAEASLPNEKDGVLKLLDFRASQIPQAIKYVQKARELTPGTSRGEGLFAIGTAIASQQSGDWKNVLDVAERALATSDASGASPLGNRRPMVEYVAAYAASRLKDAAAADVNAQALARFAAVLERYFKDDDEGVSDDDNLYRNVVLPALELPLDESSLAAAGKAQLAAVWAAKGRLLERDESLSRVGPAETGDPEDDYGRTMLFASRAYQKAHDLKPDLLTAAGYGRTALKLPRTVFSEHGKAYYQSLTDLATRYDASRTSENASLRLIHAWISFRQALTESTTARQREQVAESLRHYRFVVEATSDRDPYLLHSLALFSASNAHVRAAFCTAIGPSDLTNIEVVAADKDPAAMSKTEHLLSAVEYAQSAQLDMRRRLPEEAFTSEGNGLEDLAYYCKRLDRYPLAIDAFQRAAESTGLRSKLYPLLCKGRAQYRWAREPADTEASRADQHERMRGAFASLTEAINVPGVEATEKSEAYWWLAQLLADAAVMGPGDVTGEGSGPLSNENIYQLFQLARNASRKTAAEQEIQQRLKLSATAWKHARTAADLAAEVAPQSRVFYVQEYLTIGADLTSWLATYQRLLPDLKREAVLDEFRKLATELLQLAAEQPELVGKHRALSVVLLQERVNANIPVVNGSGDAGLLALKQHESLFASPDDRDKLVTLLLHQARHGDREALLKRATELAGEIDDEAARAKALGECSREKANGLFEKFEADSTKYLSTPAAARAQSYPANYAEQLRKDLAVVGETYAEADRQLARSFGTDVVENLERLRATPLSGLNGFEEGLESDLAPYRLRMFIDSTFQLRQDAISSLQKLFAATGWEDLFKGAKAAEKFPAAVRPSGVLLHDFLKTKAFGKTRPLTPDERRLLEIIERKL